MGNGGSSESTTEQPTVPSQKRSISTIRVQVVSIDMHSYGNLARISTNRPAPPVGPSEGPRHRASIGS